VVKDIKQFLSKTLTRYRNSLRIESGYEAEVHAVKSLASHNTPLATTLNQNVCEFKDPYLPNLETGSNSNIPESELSLLNQEYHSSEFRSVPVLAPGMEILIINKSINGDIYKSKPDKSIITGFKDVGEYELDSTIGGYYIHKVNEEINGEVVLKKLFSKFYSREPRAITVDNHHIILLTNGYLYIYDKKIKKSYYLYNTLLATAHSIVRYPGKRSLFLITGTGTDCLLKFNCQSHTLTPIWSAYDNGFNCNIDFMAGVKFFTYKHNGRFDKKIYDWAINQGAPVRKLQQDSFLKTNSQTLFPEDQPTKFQSTHLSSAIITRRKGCWYMLATVFATTRITQSKPSVGSELIAIRLNSNLEPEGSLPIRLDTDLINPHCIQQIGQNHYIVCDTGNGKIKIYRDTGSSNIQLSIVGSIHFDSSWIHSANIEFLDNNLYLTAMDSANGKIIIINLTEGIKKEIAIDKRAKVHYVKLLQHNEARPI